MQSNNSSKVKGRQPDAASRAEVLRLVGSLTGFSVDGEDAKDVSLRRDLLIEFLHLINDIHRGLPENLLVALAAEMRLPVVDVFEVASFYHHFEVLKEGVSGPTLTIRVCDGLSCQMSGAAALLADLQLRLPALTGKANVVVRAAPCVGRCDQAPAVQVGQWPAGWATVQSVESLARLAPADFTHDWRPPQDSLKCVADSPVGLAAYVSAGGYALVQQLASGERHADGVVEAMDHSGLRGLGGAGFPAGRKWRIVRSHLERLRSVGKTGHSSPQSSSSPPTHATVSAVMAVNIDEGEPGTFKDRWYLERDPHRFLEGVLVASQVVGCSRVFIYLRDEYHHARRLLTAALLDLENSGLFIKPGGVPCGVAAGVDSHQSDRRFELPVIELRRGAGAYICGEESAMIESIEGKRGMPRLRPPYIAEVGLFGLPTLAHNFETLFWVRDIVQKGGDWFASHGRNGRQGLRSFSVSGRVKQPGVKLAPAGITLTELIDEFCGGMADGHSLYAYLPGGASGGILPARLAHVPLDFDTLQPHGSFIGSAAVVVLSTADRARDAAANAMQFFAHESCGQCTPCRLGAAKSATLMQKTDWDVDTLQDLAAVMVDASICGLGQAAPKAMQSVLTYFSNELLPTSHAGAALGARATAGVKS